MIDYGEVVRHEGYEACKSGQLRSTCPYGQKTYPVKRALWLEGWDSRIMEEYTS